MGMQSMGPRIGIPLVAAVAGFCLARWATPSLPAEELLRRLDRQEARLEALARRLESQPTASPPGVPGPRTVVGMDLSGMREELRQMLREELSAVVSQDSDDARAEKKQAPAPLPPENAVAVEKVHRLLDDSLATGRWGDPQIQQLRALRGQLTDAQYHELLRKLVSALNSQQLRFEGSGPPM
jgi:hypothetical protein